MATTTRKEKTPEEIEEIVQELLRAQQVLEEQYQWRVEVAARIKRNEAHYGIPSDQIHEAIEAGRLQETLEVCDWIMDYNLLQRARSFDV